MPPAELRLPPPSLGSAARAKQTTCTTAELLWCRRLLVGGGAIAICVAGMWTVLPGRQGDLLPCLKHCSCAGLEGAGLAHQPLVLLHMGMMLLRLQRA